MEIALHFFWAFLLSYFVIPFVIYMSHTKEILDVPGSRAIHDKLTPRLGGIGVFIGLLGAQLLFGHWDVQVQVALAGALLLFLIGLKDDLVSVPVGQKLLVQLVVASIAIFVADLRITSFYGLLGVGELPPWLGAVLTYVLIVGLTNAINLIDGVDGLAGILVVWFCVVFGLFFWGVSVPFAFLAVALMGGVLAFLRYNLISGTVFLGDSGSLVAGFLVSLMVLKFLGLRATATAPVEAFALCAVPVVDTLRVMIVRTLQGRSPFSPDRLHLHHRLLAVGLRHWQVDLVLLLVSVAFVAVAFWGGAWGAHVLLLVVTLLALLLNFVIELFVRLWGND